MANSLEELDREQSLMLQSAPSIAEQLGPNSAYKNTVPNTAQGTSVDIPSGNSLGFAEREALIANPNIDTDDMTLFGTGESLTEEESEGIYRSVMDFMGVRSVFGDELGGVKSGIHALKSRTPGAVLKTASDASKNIERRQELGFLPEVGSLTEQEEESLATYVNQGMSFSPPEDATGPQKAAWYLNSAWNIFWGSSAQPTQISPGGTVSDIAFSELMQNTGLDKTFDDYGKKLMREHRLWAQKNNLLFDNENKPTYIYNVLSQAPNLAVALGLSSITRSPKAGAGFYSAIEGSEAYQSTISAGGTPDQALNNLFGATGVTMLTEGVGLGSLLNISRNAKSTMKQKALAGAVTGFTEEAVQSSALTAIQNFGGGEQVSLGEGARRAISEGLTAAPISAGFTSIAGTQGDINEQRKFNHPAMQEMFANKVLQEMKAELEVLKDANSDNPQTQSGKAMAKAQDKVAEIFKAFSEGKKIEEVYTSKRQQRRFNQEILDKMESLSDIEAKKAQEANLKDIDKGIENIAKELSSLETQGKEALESFSTKFDQMDVRRRYLNTKEGSKKMDEYRSLREKKKETSDPEMKELVSKNMREVRKEINEGYKVFESEFKSSESFQSMFEGTGVAKNILDRTDRLNLQAQELMESRIQMSDAAGLVHLAESLKNSNLKITMDEAVKFRKNAEVKAFKDGLSRGESFTKNQLSQVADIAISSINKMPISDKAKSKLKNSISGKRGALRAKDPANALGKILLRGGVIAQKEVKSEFTKDLKGKIKDFSAKVESGALTGKTPDFALNETLTAMNRYTRNKAKGVKAISELADLGVSEDLIAIADRYVALLESGDKASIQETAHLLDDISFAIENAGETPSIGLDRALRLADGRKRIVDPNISKISQTDLDNAGKMNPVDALSHYVNFILESSRSLFKLIGVPESMMMFDGQAAHRDMIRHYEDTINERLNDRGLSPQDVHDRSSKKSIKKYDSEYKAEDVIDFIVDQTIGMDEGAGINKAKKISSDFISVYGDVSTKDSFINMIDSAESMEEIGSILYDSGAKRDVPEIQITPMQSISFVGATRNPAERTKFIHPMGGQASPIRTLEAIENDIAKDSGSSEMLDMYMELYQELYPQLNKSYKDNRNISLPKVDNYFTSMKEIESSDIDSDLLDLFGVNGVVQEQTPSSLKSRTNSMRKFKVIGADQVFKKYLDASAAYIHMKQPLDDLNTLLRDPEVQKSIAHKHGARTRSRVNRALDELSIEFSNKKRRSPENISWMIDNWKAAVLAWKLVQLPKQFTSIFAMGTDMPIWEFVKRLPEAIMNMPKEYAVLEQHPTFKYRAQQRDSDFDPTRGRRGMSHLGERSKHSKLGRVKDVSQIPTKVGDKAPVVAGGAVYKNYLMEDIGLSEKDAVRWAAEKAEATQQSTIPTNKPVFQMEHPLTTKVVMPFTSSAGALWNGLNVSFRRFKNSDKSASDVQEFMEGFFVYQILSPFLFLWATNGADMDDEAIEQDLIMSSVKGPLGGIPFIGDAIEKTAVMLANSLTDSELKAFGVTNVDHPMDELTEKLMKAVEKYDEEGVTNEHVADFLLELTDVTTGVGAGNFVNVSTAWADFLQGGDFQDFLEGIGMTEKQAETRVEGR